MPWEDAVICNEIIELKYLRSTQTEEQQPSITAKAGQGPDQKEKEPNSPIGTKKQETGDTTVRKSWRKKRTELTKSQWVDLQSWSSEKKRKWNQEGYEKEERRKRVCTEKEKGVEKDDEVNKAISRSVTFACDGDYLEAARALNNKPLLDPLHPITIKLMEELEKRRDN